MGILCKIFGHQPPVYAEKSWYSPGEEYGKLHALRADEIGRVHAEVWFECPRCQHNYMAGRVHLPKREVSQQ